MRPPRPGFLGDNVVVVERYMTGAYGAQRTKHAHQRLFTASADGPDGKLFAHWSPLLQLWVVL